MKKIRIGSGAGYAGDRIEPAVELMEKGNLDYIIFECLAERTVAIGQQDKEKDPSKGYNQLLDYRMEKILPLMAKNKVKVITNMGAANPVSAAELTCEIARKLGVSGLKIACVTGDDITDELDKYENETVLEDGTLLKEKKDVLISANVYMGAEGITKALEEGANLVITGRVSDPALTIGPLVHEFGWNITDNPDQMGQAVLAGHLLECAGQVTGGYFADPGYKDVPDLWKLGFPLIEIDETGAFTVTKVEGSGGLVSVDTCKEQMIYEIHNPKAYLTPDATADFSKVTFRQIGENQVHAEHATTHGRPETLKVSVGYKDCFIGDGEISYGGPGCVARGRLALDIIKERLELVAPGVFDELKFDLIGCNSLYWNPDFKYNEEPSEVRVRVSGRAKARADAELIGNEVEALYTNGPAGGCGAVKRTRDIVSVASILVSRCDVKPEVEIFEV